MNARQVKAMQAMMGFFNGGDPSVNWQERRPSPALGLPHRLEGTFTSVEEAAQALKSEGIANVLRVQVSISREALQQAQLNKQMEAVIQLSASDEAPAPASAPAAPASDPRIDALESQLQQLIQLQLQNQPAPPSGGDSNNS